MTENPDEGDVELAVVRIQLAPILAAHNRCCARRGERLRLVLDNPAPVGTPLLPLAAELPRQVGILLVQAKDPRYPSGEGGAGLYSRDEEVPKKRNVWIYPNIVFAHMRENRHREDGVGSEVKKVEAEGVHYVAEEVRKRRAKTAVKEGCEEIIPAGVVALGGGRIGSGAGMRLGLLGPEQVVLVPELPRAELRREDEVLLPQQGEHRRVLRFLLLGLLRLRLLGLRGHGGGGEGRETKEPVAPQVRASGGGKMEAERKGDLWRRERTQQRRRRGAAPASSALYGEVADTPFLPSRIVRDVTRACA